MHLSVFHVKQLFLFDGMEGLQQVVEVVHAVILQFDAALFPPSDDPTAAPQGISQIAGGLLSIVYGDAGGGGLLPLFGGELLHQYFRLADGQVVFQNGGSGCFL